MTFDTPERVNNGWPGTGRVDRLVASYLVLLAVVGVAVAITELVRTSASERHVVGALLLLLGSALTWALWHMYVSGPSNWWPAIFLLGYWWGGVRVDHGHSQCRFAGHRVGELPGYLARGIHPGEKPQACAASRNIGRSHAFPMKSADNSDAQGESSWRSAVIPGDPRRAFVGASLSREPGTALMVESGTVPS